MTNTSHPQPPHRQMLKEFLLFVSIPVALIAVIAGFVLLPSVFAKPRYDFIYSNCPMYNCGNNYQVQGVQIKSVDLSEPGDPSYYTGAANAQLYYYNVKNRSTKPISYAAAKQYTLDTSNTSPDGYTLEQNNAGGGFLFWGSSYDSHWYLKKGSAKKQVNLASPSYYDGNIQFLGWVEQ